MPVNNEEILLYFQSHVDEWELSACGFSLFRNFGLLHHYCSTRSSERRQGTSHAESHTRQEMFSLADACRITAGPHNRHNIRDTIPNERANICVDKWTRGPAPLLALWEENVMNVWGIWGENMLFSLGIYNWCKHTFLLFDCLETQYHIVLQRMAFIPKKGI